MVILHGLINRIGLYGDSNTITIAPLSLNY